MLKILLFSFLSLQLFSENLRSIYPSKNQTQYITDPLPEDSLPFSIKIEQESFSLPVGLQGFVSATYKGEWLIISGRDNGMHNMGNTDPNFNPFPPSKQNTTIFVINPKTRKVFSRSLLDPAAQLPQRIIEELSASDPLYFQSQNQNVLYIVGGYGIDSETNIMTTKSTATALDVPDVINWVKNPENSKPFSKFIRQTSHPLLQSTGGVLMQSNPHQPLLVSFGQNFTKNYLHNSQGVYKKKISPLQIIDNGKKLYVLPYDQPETLDTYRRRDLNVVNIIKKSGTSFKNAYVALSGVFLPEPNGLFWSVPIQIEEDGSSFMADPNDSTTFAQGMNGYSSAHLGLYSAKTNDMYTVLFGGISFLIESDGKQNSCNKNPPINKGILTPCTMLPFVNDVTTIKIDSNGTFSQYLMKEKFPTIIATFGPSPGGPILFGTEATFIPDDTLPMYSNSVINLDKLGSEPLFLGYIIGGIGSSVPHTQIMKLPGQSIASHYIFKVTLEPR